MKKRVVLAMLFGLLVAGTPAQADYNCVATCACPPDFREAMASCRAGDAQSAINCAALAACRHCPSGKGTIIRSSCDHTFPTQPLPIEEFW